MAQLGENNHFQELQRETFRTVKKVYQTSQTKLWRSGFWADLFIMIMAAVTIGGVAAYFLITTWGLSPNALELYFDFNRVPGRVGNLFFVAGMTLLYLVFVIPPITFISRMKKPMKGVFRTIYFVVFLPLSLLVYLQFATNYLNNGSLGEIDFLAFLPSWIVLVLGCLLFVAVCLCVLSQVPYWFFLVLSKPIYAEQKTYFPTYDSIVTESVSMLIFTLSNWQEDAVSEALELARQKYTGLGAQAQAFSPVIGAFSLLGLFAVLFSQQELRQFLLSVEQMLGPEFVNISITTVIIVVLSLLCLSIRYFMRILIAMRVLDIIVVLLNKRLRELTGQGKADNNMYNLVNGIYLPTSLSRR